MELRLTQPALPLLLLISNVSLFACERPRCSVVFSLVARAPGGPLKTPGAGPPGDGPAPALHGGLADVDPDTVPANMKVEGPDWFAL